MKNTCTFLKRVVLATALCFATAAGAYDGRLLEAATGRPMENVWVLGHWETGGGLAIPRSGCAMAIARTNSNGEFSLVSGEGFFGRLFGLRSRPAIYFYKRGYRARLPSPEGEKDPFHMEPDSGSGLERLDALVLMLSQTECDTSPGATRKAELSELYRDVNGEAKEIAQTAREQRVQGAIQWYVELLELGYDEAVRRARDRSQSQHSLPSRRDEK